MTGQRLAHIINSILANQQPGNSSDCFRILLERLGNPHLRLPPTIHIAGTNGKGSTLAYLNSILLLKGCKVHRYTSPHLVSICERIQLANQPITEASLERHLDYIQSHAQDLSLSFFEIMTAAAFLEFSRTPADYVLLETGIGGQYDPTNVITSPVATIISQIGYDHVDLLGPSLVSITEAKAGIIKAGRPIITYLQDPIIMGEIKAEAEKKNAELILADTDLSYKTGLLGPHQHINASLAAVTTRLLGISEDVIARGIASAQWPGRMQKINYEGREIWLDMAHNPSAAAVAAASMEALGQSPFHLIFSLRTSKDLEGFIQAFKDHLLSLSYVPITDAYAAGHGVEEVKDVCKELGLSVTVAETLNEALAPTPEGPILIAGSALLLGKALF